MAKRELEAPSAGEELQTAKGRASDINRREERCCQVYEEGVKSLNTGRSSYKHREKRRGSWALFEIWRVVIIIILSLCPVDFIKCENNLESLKQQKPLITVEVLPLCTVTFIPAALE